MTPSPIQDVDTGGIPGVQIIYDFIDEAEERFLINRIDQVGNGSGSGLKGNFGWKELNGRKSMYWGGTVLPNTHSLIPTDFPKFMDREWPNVIDRIAETKVYDEWSGGGDGGNEAGKKKGKERGPNHCLVNEYLPGQGILPHTDGPAYRPCTTTLSLGSHTILSLRSKPDHLKRQEREEKESKESKDSPSSSTANTTTTASTPVSSSSLEKDNDEPSKTPLSSTTDAIEKYDILLPSRSLLFLSSTLYQDYLHGIQPLSYSSIESLKGCRNWEGWWKWKEEGGDGGKKFFRRRNKETGVEGSGEKEGEENGKVEAVQGEEVEEGESEGEEVEEESMETPLERTTRVRQERSLVESGQGWERGKRISLTCRRVAGKVRKIKLG